MKVAPEADPSDGWFDTTLWSGFGLGDFLLKAGALYDGSHVRLGGTRCFRCQTLRAESTEEVLLDVDGEQPGMLPCTIRILPRALSLKVD
jgi:diacylglycerol kinase family enzyme